MNHLEIFYIKQKLTYSNHHITNIKERIKLLNKTIIE